MKIKITILVNKTAGNGNAKIIFNRVIKILNNKSLSYTVMQSNYPGELIPLAEKYANLPHTKYDRLLVIGGDGSLNQVLNGIKKSHHPDTPIAYLPAGTGNDFARAANLTKNPEQLIETLSTTAQVYTVDCGKFTTNQKDWQYFVNNFGIGFDAYVVHKSNHEQFKKVLNKIKLGKLIYGINIINALAAQNNFKVSVYANSKEYHYNDTYFITTTNHPYFGGGIAILPKAHIHNNVLDAVIVEKPTLFKFARLFFHVLKDGTHVNDPHFHDISAKEIRVETYQPEYGQIDGEDTKKQNFQLTLKIDHFNIIK